MGFPVKIYLISVQVQVQGDVIDLLMSQHLELKMLGLELKLIKFYYKKLSKNTDRLIDLESADIFVISL